MKAIFPLPQNVNCLTIEKTPGGGYFPQTGLAVTPGCEHIEGLPSCTLSKRQPPAIETDGRVHLASLPSSSSDGSATLGAVDANNPGWLFVKAPSAAALQLHWTLTPDVVYLWGRLPVINLLDDETEWFAVDLAAKSEPQNRRLIIAQAGTLKNVLEKYFERIQSLQSVLGGAAQPSGAETVTGLAAEAIGLLGSIRAELACLADC